MIALYILTSIGLAFAVINLVITVLVYERVIKTAIYSASVQGNNYTEAAKVKKHIKPNLPAKKEVKRGKQITDQEELVDLADMDWEDGYKIVTEMFNGES